MRFMLETASLKYSFDFFPLALSFPLYLLPHLFLLQSTLSCWNRSLQCCQATQHKHCTNEWQRNKESAYSWITWTKNTVSILPARKANFHSQHVLFKKKKNQQNTVLWSGSSSLLQASAGEQETEIRWIWNSFITWWHKGGWESSEHKAVSPIFSMERRDVSLHGYHLCRSPKSS